MILPVPAQFPWTTRHCKKNKYKELKVCIPFNKTNSLLGMFVPYLAANVQKLPGCLKSWVYRNPGLHNHASSGGK